MRSKFRKYIPVVILAPLALVLTQFTSCDSYTPVSAFNQSSLSSSSCSGDLCFSQDEQDLRINSGQAQIYVGLSQRVMNVAGYCDEAGFPNNLIYWEVKDGTTGATKFSTDLNNYNLASFSCIDGRFAMSVEVPQGLQNFQGNRIQHSLHLRIVGIDSNGKLYADGANATTIVSFLPLIVN